MPNVYTAYVMESLFEENGGSGQIIVLRKKSPMKVEAGIFLVDAYCLGIRGTVLFEGTESEVMERIAADELPYREMSGSYGRKFVEEAILYAKQFGFAPHKGYKKAARVFGGLKAADDLEGFTFGKNGKPCYIQSENHDMVDAQRIMAKLRKVCGEGGFHFICKIENDDSEEEERLLLSEGWLPSAHQGKVADEPSPAAKRTFIEFADHTESIDDVLLNKHVWEPSDSVTTLDRLSQAAETVLDMSPSDVHLSEEEAKMMLISILMYLMNLLEKDEDEVEAEFSLFAAKAPPGLYDIARDLFKDESIRELLAELVHPSPGVTISPVSLEMIDEVSGHYLLICIEECDPDGGAFEVNGLGTPGLRGIL